MIAAILAMTIPLTLSFPGPVVPPAGTVFVGEVGLGTFGCSVIAAKCVFNVDALLWQNTQAICVYEKTAPSARQCFYTVELKVQQPKRRSVGKRSH